MMGFRACGSPLTHSLFPPPMCKGGRSAYNAATVSAPADVVWTRLQSREAHQHGGAPSITSCVATIWRQGGVGGFYRGWTANVMRMAPTFIVGTTIYEQTRHVLGIGYLT